MIRIHKNKRACDRCHAQKLLCRRENDNDPCVRCSTARAVCHISPRPRQRKVVSLRPQSPVLQLEDTKGTVHQTLKSLGGHPPPRSVSFPNFSQADLRPYDLPMQSFKW